jgi:lipoic acid synthetase
MVGLGEEPAEVRQAMSDLRDAGCDVITLGQYLRPSAKHLPVARFYPPEEFEALAADARALGFRHVESGPLVRSSYRAAQQSKAGGS